MRSWHHRQLITAAAACAAGALSILPAIPASVASASPRPIRALPIRLPPDAAIGNNAASLLVAIDCVRPRSCTAGGGYANRQNRLAPMVASQVSGRWRRAIGLALPPNSGGERLSDVASVDCAVAGDCTAVGLYSASDERTFGFVARESRGRWGQAREIALPRNGSRAYGSASGLSGVACTGPGTCLAVGQYEVAAGGLVPMAVTESRGRWSRAVELGLPANATHTSDQRGSLQSVACQRQGSCTAVGAYVLPSGDIAAMTISESGGTWQRPAEIAAPPGAIADDSELGSVSCTGPGSCTAAGFYTDRSGNSQAMVAAQSGGRWARARAMSKLPGNADTTQPYSLNAVSCIKAGDCIAAGTYTSKTGGTRIWIANETAGTWAASSQVTLPADAGNDFLADDAATDVDCTRSGDCAFGGFYNTRSSIQRAIVAALPAH